MPKERHFEKRGRRNLSRRIATSGAKLRVTLGLAADYEQTFTATFETAARAERAAERWAIWALNDGYAEVARPRGELGRVSALEEPAGRGRIRTDRGRNVYFDRESTSPNVLRQGERVIVQGISKDPELKLDFLFGSQLRARRVVPFPAVDWKRHKVAPDMTPAQQRKLLAAIGDAIEGHRARESRMKAVPMGVLIFAYEKGIHRLLGGTKDRAGNFVRVLYEPVFSSKLARMGGPLSSWCISEFCTSVPRPLARELQAFLDAPANAHRMPRRVARSAD